MPLINTSVPNLIQGVSQQPNSARFVGQCEEQINALSSVADGLKKRPNTEHVARLLAEELEANSFVHFIERSDSEKYFVIQYVDPNDYTQNILKAFNADSGAACTINGAASYVVDGSDYSFSNSPSQHLSALTISDATFLNNNLKTPQLTSDRTPSSQKEAIVVVTQGDYDTDYTVKLSSVPILTGSAEPAGTAATFNPPNLVERTPATSPPTYELDSTQYGPAPQTTSPLTAGGEGYTEENSDIFVTSTAQIDTLPEIEAVVSGGAITQLDLINAGVFQASLGSSTTLSLSINFQLVWDGVNNSGRAQGYYRYSMSISGQSLIDYNAAGRPVLNLNLNTLNLNIYGYPINGGIVELLYNTSTYQWAARDFTEFPSVQFSDTGFYSGSKYYNNVSLQNDWVPYHFIVDNGQSVANQTHNKNIQVNTYVAPTVTLTAGTPATQSSQVVQAAINSAAATDTNARENINTNKIAEQLKTALVAANTSGLFSIQQDNNILILRPNSPTQQDFYVSASDGLAGTGLQLLYNEVDAISDLPVYCKNGFKIKIKGDPSVEADDYYVQFQTNDNATFGSGVWVETIGFDVKTKIDPDTMPHGLINVGFNEFVYSAFNGLTKTAPIYGDYTFQKWADRKVGDDDSNPFSTFIGDRPIQAMTLFKNRLGFTSGANVVFSEAGYFFNLCRTTVTSLLDSAPIDISVSSPKVTDIKDCVSFQGSLILFSDNIQLKLAGGDILSPRTVSVTPLTQFSYDSIINPIVLGSYIYYPFDRGLFSGINEFKVNATTDVYDANDITEQVSSYIPQALNLMDGTTANNILVAANQNQHDLYVYVYFWNNNSKVLSSWSKFTFNGKIQGLRFSNSTLYLILTENGETNLVRMSVEDGVKDDIGYNTLLDNRVSKTVTAGSNTISLPYTPANNSVEVYTKNGVKLGATNSGATVTLSSPVSVDTDVWVGIPYTMRYVFSEQLFKAPAEQGKSPSSAANIKIRNGALYYSDSAAFTVKVTPSGRSTYENVFTPDPVTSETLGAVNIDSGFFRFPVLSKPKDTEIVIESSSALPCNFTNAEFESFVNSRSNRYG